MLRTSSVESPRRRKTRPPQRRPQPPPSRRRSSQLSWRLVNFLIQLRDHWRLLKALCRHDYDRDFFMRSRILFRKTIDPIEAARLFYTVSRQSYRSLPRTSTWDETKERAFLNGLSHFET